MLEKFKKGLTTNLICYKITLKVREVIKMLYKLRKFRQENKIPVKSFLKLLGSEYDITYFRKEQGKNKFSLKEAYDISKKFNIPIEFFLESD